MFAIVLSTRWRVRRADFGCAIGIFIATLLAVSVATPARAGTIAVADQVVIETDDWWQEVPSGLENTTELVGGRAPDGGIQARASVMILRHSSDQAALARLQREARLAESAQALRIAGRPAVRATDQIELERRVQDLPPVVSRSQQIATFIAVGPLVVKITVTLANNSQAESLARAEQFAFFIWVEGTLSATELDRSIADIERAIATRPRSLTSPLFFSGAAPKVVPLTKRITQSAPPVLAAARGELQVAASGDGTDVVIATNSGTVFSNDGGTTWSANQTLPRQNLVGVNFQTRGSVGGLRPLWAVLSELFGARATRWHQPRHGFGGDQRAG